MKDNTILSGLTLKQSPIFVQQSLRAAVPSAVASAETADVAAAAPRALETEQGLKPPKHHRILRP